MLTTVLDASNDSADPVMTTSRAVDGFETSISGSEMTMLLPEKDAPSIDTTVQDAPTTVDTAVPLVNTQEARTLSTKSNAARRPTWSVARFIPTRKLM